MKTVVKKGEIKRKRVPSMKDIDEVKAEENLLDIVESELEDEGIKMFDNNNIDNGYLHLPLHLDEESPAEIGRYLHAMTQQRIWARTLLARIGILLKEQNEKLDRIKAVVFAENPVKMSITEKELKLYENEKAVEIIENIKLISAKYDMLDSYMKNLEDAIFDISREISRRGLDFSSQSRLENVKRN